MVGLFFSTPKFPIVEVFPQTAPQPALQTLVVRMRSELPWLIALVEVRILYTPQVSSVLDWEDRVIGGHQSPPCFYGGHDFCHSPSACWHMETWKPHRKMEAFFLFVGQIFTSRSDLHGFSLSVSCWDCLIQNLKSLFSAEVGIIQTSLVRIYRETKVGKQANSIHYITFKWTKILTNE